MSTTPALPLDLPDAQRRKKQRRADAGQRASKRVTSFGMQLEDEMILDALRAEYGTHLTGEAIRRAMREAAAVRGIDVDHIARRAAAA